LRNSLCYCRACQRRTGSAFGLAAYFAEDQVTVSGQSTVYERRSDAGRWARTQFCPTCGTSLLWRLEFRPGQIGIAAGAFEELDFPAPKVSVWTRFRRHWLAQPEGVEAFPEQS
jgi:hypothetical protein